MYVNGIYVISSFVFSIFATRGLAPANGVSAVIKTVTTFYSKYYTSISIYLYAVI